MRTLHLMTQDDQPYGSERRCCEECGLMMINRDAEFWTKHQWTDRREVYANPPEDYTECGLAAKPQPSQHNESE